MQGTGRNGDLPGTDGFIERCEQVRAWNYVVRARAQARLAPPIEPADSAVFGAAQVWFAGTRARVHLLDEASLSHLPALEAWLAERNLRAQFDVLPVLACRPVALALGERGYRLVAWQPTLYRDLSVPIESDGGAVQVQQLSSEDAEFRDTFMRGYEMRTAQSGAGAVLEARWRAEGARRFLARIDGEPVAAATLVVFEGIARLANCATLPHARNSGAQSALIRARLRHASTEGLTLATSDARQGGASLRNLVRARFAISAHITQWQKP